MGFLLQNCEIPFVPNNPLTLEIPGAVVCLKRPGGVIYDTSLTAYLKRPGGVIYDTNQGCSNNYYNFRRFYIKTFYLMWVLSPAPFLSPKRYHRGGAGANF